MVKQPGSSKILANEPIFDIEFNRGENNPAFAIFHTRLATQGSEHSNKNNHPIISKKGTILVHNGIIHNDRLIKQSYQFDGEVDSEAILRVYEDPDYKTIEEKVEAVFTLVSGSYACAIIDKESDKLVLFRHDNPIDLAYDEIQDILYFASDLDYITDAVKSEKVIKRGILLSGLKEVTFPNNSMLVIGPESVEKYKEMKYSAGTVYYGNTTTYYGKEYSRYSRYGTYEDETYDWKTGEYIKSPSMPYSYENEELAWICEACGSNCTSDLELVADSSDEYIFWLYENNCCPACAQLYYSEALNMAGIWPYQRSEHYIRTTKKKEEKNEADTSTALSQVYD